EKAPAGEDEDSLATAHDQPPDQITARCCPCRRHATRNGMLGQVRPEMRSGRVFARTLAGFGAELGGTIVIALKFKDPSATGRRKPWPAIPASTASSSSCSRTVPLTTCSAFSKRRSPRSTA